MSVFNPISLTGQPDQKKALLDRLMQQYQEAASRATGLQQAQSSVGGVGGVVGSTPFHAVHPFGGMGLVTAAPRVLNPGLAARLGPGAIGTPAVGHGLGNPIAAPRAGGNIAAAAGPVNPIAAVLPPAVSNPGSAAAAPNPAGDKAAVLTGSQAADQIVARRPNIYMSPFHAFGVGRI